MTGEPKRERREKLKDGDLLDLMKQVDYAAGNYHVDLWNTNKVVKSIDDEKKRQEYLEQRRVVTRELVKRLVDKLERNVILVEKFKTDHPFVLDQALEEFLILEENLLTYYQKLQKIGVDAMFDYDIDSDTDGIHEEAKVLFSRMQDLREKKGGIMYRYEDVIMRIEQEASQAENRKVSLKQAVDRVRITENPDYRLGGFDDFVRDVYGIDK